jgi:MscS family membrane protein
VLWKRVALGTILIRAMVAQAGPPAASKGDPLGRENPRATVTHFLETCRTGDYEKAAQYLDLDRIPPGEKASEGISLAKQLEAILNSAVQLNIDSLSQDPDGNNTQNVTQIKRYGQAYTLTVARKPPANGSDAIWQFSAETVASIPELAPSAENPWIGRYLPKLFSTIQLLETPIWKWIALALGAIVLLSISRILDRLFSLFTGALAGRGTAGWVPWAREVIRPVRVMVILAVFRLFLEVVDPSAVARLYIGRVLQLILAITIAWCILNLIDLFFRRIETMIDVRHRTVSRSLIHMGRRTANALVVIFTLLVLLSNWGYNTNTLLAGLGVGGIAVALAAQQTIANVFGGVSVIGDHPVSIGEFGKFGDLLGTVEDIGMRSTRVRTLNRTVVSVPNSSFASFNLENYSVRDKILFNPTFQIQRSTPEEKIHALIDALGKALGADKHVELGPTPVRLTGLAAASFSLEIFCYVLTAEIDEFYQIQGGLLLAVSNTLKSTGVELA